VHRLGSRKMNIRSCRYLIVKESKIGERLEVTYHVMYYDSFSMEWEPSGQEMGNLEEAKAIRDRENADLDRNTIECGDHYGVINLDIGLEEQCPLNELRDKFRIPKSEMRCLHR
jgi:hypothetical protein